MYGCVGHPIAMPYDRAKSNRNFTAIIKSVPDESLLLRVVSQGLDAIELSSVMNISRKFHYLVMVLLLMTGCKLLPNESSKNNSFSYPYRSYALQGNLSEAEIRLAENEDQADLLAQFRARFVEKTDGLNLSDLRDPMIRELGEAYQQYWRNALVSPDGLEGLESMLNSEVRKIVSEYSPEIADIDPNEVFNRIASVIEDRGFRAIGGRTPPLLELMIWRQDRSESLVLELSDGTHTVPITYQDGFVFRGWAHFATFGESSAGGWATRDGLFCVTEAYDLESENFLVSFLKHEGRHYVDYKMFPALSSPDLEYRAKLTELMYATNTVVELLYHFSANAARTDYAPHTLANWHIVQNLKSKLQLDDTTQTRWEDIGIREIAFSAKELLDENYHHLIEAGASTTTGVILP